MRRMVTPPEGTKEGAAIVILESASKFAQPCVLPVDGITEEKAEGEATLEGATKLNREPVDARFSHLVRRAP